MKCYITFNIEPRLFTNSTFGDGDYPIIYSNLACGGWEDNVISECKKDTYSDFTCSRGNVAGVLCGYGELVVMQC